MSMLAVTSFRSAIRPASVSGRFRSIFSLPAPGVTRAATAFTSRIWGTQIRARLPAPAYDIHTSPLPVGWRPDSLSENGERDGLGIGRVRGPAPRKKGADLLERLVAHGARGVRVRRLGGDRAGEMRITRFLRNPAVTLDEMTGTAFARTEAACAGRDVLAVQDTPVTEG